MDDRSCNREALTIMPIPALTARFIRPVLIAVLMLCLCLAGLVLLATGTDVDLQALSSNPMLLPALALQVIASLLFIKAWQSILSLQHDIDYRLAEATAHIGITLLGKYLPGKIWGLVGRTFLLTRRGQRASVAMRLLLADQFITFYTGGAIGLIALTALYSVPLSLILLLTALGGVALCRRYAAPILIWLVHHFRFLTRRFQSMQLASEVDKEVAAWSGRAFVIYTLHWLVSAAVLWLLFFPVIAADPIPGILVITAALPLAMLLGFLAVWAPGGIGVREGVLVAILALQFSLEQAATIAISYRLICIAIDLVIGTLALGYLSRAGRELLTQEQDPA